MSISPGWVTACPSGQRRRSAAGSSRFARTGNLYSVQALLVRALLCFGRVRLRPDLLRLGFLGSYVTLRGGLVLLGGTFLFQRLVPDNGSDRFLRSTLYVFHGAFDAGLRARLIRQRYLPLVFT